MSLSRTPTCFLSAPRDSLGSHRMVWWESLTDSQSCCPELRARRDVHCSGAFLNGRGCSAASYPQALGNGSHCLLRFVSIALSPHSSAALANIRPSWQRTPFGTPHSVECFSTGETICPHSLPLPPLAVILGPSHSMLFQTPAQKCFALHAEAFMCNPMNRSNSGTGSLCRDS